MKARFVLLCGAVVAAAVGVLVWNSMKSRTDLDVAKKIIGVWEDPEGGLYEFHTDGKFVRTVCTKEGVPLAVFEGTFELKGRVMTLTVGGLSQEDTIVDLTRDEMVTRPFKSDPAKLSRLKRKN